MEELGLASGDWRFCFFRQRADGSSARGGVQDQVKGDSTTEGKISSHESHSLLPSNEEAISQSCDTSRPV
jgi:hypothetical protein